MTKFVLLKLKIINFGENAKFNVTIRKYYDLFKDCCRKFGVGIAVHTTHFFYHWETNMTTKTIEMFEAELAAARELLKKTGKNTSNLSPSFEPSESPRDFDLPYSTLPKIYGNKWNNTVRFAR